MIADFQLSEDKNSIIVRPRDFSLSQVKALVGYVKTINGQIVDDEIVIPVGNKGIVDLYTNLEKIFVKRLPIFDDTRSFLFCNNC